MASQPSSAVIVSRKLVLHLGSYALLGFGQRVPGLTKDQIRYMAANVSPTGPVQSALLYLRSMSRDAEFSREEQALSGFDRESIHAVD